MNGTPPVFEKKSFAMQLKCFLKTQNLDDMPPKVICLMSLIEHEIPELEILFYIFLESTDAVP